MANSMMDVINRFSAFHDYRLGCLEMDQSSTLLTIEDHDGAKSVSDVKRVGAFRFQKIESFKLSLDLVTGAWIFEVEEDRPGELYFSLDNGSIEIKAGEVFWCEE